MASREGSWGRAQFRSRRKRSNSSVSNPSADRRRGEVTELLLETTPSLPANAALRVDTEAHVEASLVAVTSAGIRLRVVAPLGDQALGELRVYRQSGAGEFLLSSVQLVAPPPPSTSPTSPYPRLHVGALAGLLESRLEDGPPDYGEAPLLGARATIGLAAHLELEAEVILSHRSADDGHILASNQLFVAWRESLGANWAARARVGPALWHSDDPDTSRSTRVGGALGVSLERALGPGAVRLDLLRFVLAGASYRLGGSLSYQWEVDLVGK